MKLKIFCRCSLFPSWTYQHPCTHCGGQGTPRAVEPMMMMMCTLNKSEIEVNINNSDKIYKKQYVCR